MENLDGALGFRTTLDIDDFDVSADAMERRIRDFSRHATDGIGDVEDSFRRMAEKAGEYISYYLVGQGMKQLVMSIVQVRGQFQQLETAFETMLGSSEKANALMKQMVDTAAKTPFDLMGVAEGAKQLLAYGVSADKVNDTLVRLGNVASGLSIPLNDIVYLYGTTMVQGRLYAQDVRQFTGRGIPLVKELANMYGKNADEINAMVSAGKIGFADVEKVLNKMTDAGGQFYNLMGKQSASLTGQISNLQDAWDGVLNAWGEAGQDVFAAGISSATYLVEHMDDVVRILKAVAIAYGSVKAATILNSVATKGYTGVAVIDNTVRSAKLALMKAESVATGKLSAGLKTLWITIKANPFGWLLTIIGLVWSAITMLTSKTDETKDTMQEFAEGTKAVTDKLDLYFAILQKSAKGSKVYKDMLEKINAICQEYNVTLLDENATLKEQEKRYLEVKAAVQATTAEKIKAKRVEEEMNAFNEQADKDYASFEKRVGNLQYNTGRTRQVTDRATGEEYEIPIQKAAKHIQSMAPEVKDAIRSLVEGGATELAKLSGEEYSKKYDETITQIVAATKAGTKAAGQEMRSFEEQLKEYLDKRISGANNLRAVIERVDGNLNAFLAPKDTSNLEGVADYTELSFEELDKQIAQTRKDIDAINNSKVGPEADTAGLDNLLRKLGMLKNALKGKTADLDTREGISSRIKQLKDELETARIGSAEERRLQSEIASLSARMPNDRNGGKGAAKSADQAAKALGQKQLEAGKRLEQARLAVMEEGYAKRKAALDLQHKEVLKEIDKEEKELADARKKAGKGQLTKEERDGFTERRSLENQGYEQEKNKLFEGELDYKKKQYALYFRWVENMGKEVADKQFASLLKGGASYKGYIDAQIKQLNAKKDAGTLSEGDGNYLIQLNAQYDELTGAKTALESFKEQVNESIDRCTTLAEKIEVVAKAQQKLDNGESGIVSADDRATASLGLSQQGADLQKQLNDKVLKDYQTYEEQKQDILKDYAKMREVAEKEGNQGRIDLINQGEQNALSALNTSFLQQSDSWKKLFSDLDTLSVGQIQKLVKDVQGQLNRGDLKLSPVDYKAVVDSLNQAKRRIEELNPFKALGQYFKDYSDAKKKLADLKVKEAAGGATKAEVDAAEREVRESANGMSDSIKQIEEISTKCAQSLQSMFDALGMDGAAEALGTAIELMGELGNAAASVGKIMEGDVVGGVSGLVGAVTSVVGIFVKLHDGKYEKRIQNLQKQLDELERAYSRLERAFNNTYWVFNDAEREGYESNIRLIEQQIAALERQRDVARNAWDMTRYAQLTAQISQLNDQLSKSKEGDDMLGLYERQMKSLEEQKGLLKQQIDNEEKKKKTDDGKVQGWKDQMAQIDEQMEDMRRQMMETFAGTDIKSAIDQFADAIVDAYCAGEDAAKALGETTKAVLKKAVVEALKRNFLAKGINDAIEFLGGSMEDGVLDDKEKAEFERLAEQAGETFKSHLEAIGDWIKDMDGETTTDPLTGAVASMSEETAGVIAGRLNAFIINQAAQTSVLRDQLLAQSDIARNTAMSAQRLEQIEQTLKRIETKDNTLLSQGIS